MSSESGTSFWPRVKEYIHEQKSAVEGPLRCLCPVCLDPLDVVGLPIDTAQDRQPAKVLPCGHMYCTKCLDILEASDYKRCPTCRMSVECQGCERKVGAAHVPARGRTVEAIDGVRLTTSEGGRHGTHCLTCVQNRSWRDLIRAQRYPAATGGLPFGFVPLVYNLMEEFERSRRLRPTLGWIHYYWGLMMTEHFEALNSHTHWGFLLHRTWPEPLEDLTPGFVQFFYGRNSEAQTIQRNGRLLEAYHTIFLRLLRLHFETLDQARDEYFTDISARFEQENMWFGQVEWVR